MRVVIVAARPTRNLLAAVLAFIAFSGGAIHAAESQRIVNVTLGKPIVYANSHGDVWEATWADDGELYSCSDDTNGFNNACHSNFAYHKLSGDDPARLVGVTVNPMRDYGEELRRGKGRLHLESRRQPLARRGAVPVDQPTPVRLFDP